MTERIAYLAAGLRWLFDTEQPPGAVVSPLGDTLKGPDNRSYSFAPSGAAGLPVIVADVITVRYTERQGERYPANPLAPNELDRMAREIDLLGYRVVDSWNGFPGTTGSLTVSTGTHPTLAAAVAAYRAGCTVHPDQNVFCSCEHRRACLDLAVRPTPPTD